MLLTASRPVAGAPILFAPLGSKVTLPALWGLREELSKSLLVAFLFVIRKDVKMVLSKTCSFERGLKHYYHDIQRKAY